MSAQILDFNDPPGRALDAATADALRAHVSAAKERGWGQPDLSSYFSDQHVSLAEYRKALSGEPVDQGAAAALTQLSITGLPDRPAPVPDMAAMLEHFAWLIEPARGVYDDALLEVAYDDEDGSPRFASLFGFDELRQAATIAAAKNRAGHNVYLGASLKLPDATRNRRTTEADFYAATAVRIDIDADVEAVRERFAAVCASGLTVTTGTVPELRQQHWTRLVEPCEALEDYRHALDALVSHAGADPKVKDPARLMRLGGTINIPKGGKLAKGRRPELTTVAVDASAATIDVERLKGLEPGLASGPRFDATNRPEGSGIERDEQGRVCNGRESWFRDLLLIHIRRFQAEHGADPDAEQLWDLAFAEFSDPAKLWDDDQRWTNPAGQKQLRQRLNNTLRRLRLGFLARRGLASIDTGAGADEAARREASFQAKRKPRLTSAGQVSPSIRQAVEIDGEHEPRASVPTPSLPALDPWERWIVPRFPMDLLPAPLGDFVDYRARTIGVDPNGVALAALVVCSAAISHDFRLAMMRTGDWHVRPRLWGLLVGDPSDRKTPIMNAVVGPLQDRDAEAVAAYQRRVTAHEAAVKAGEADKNDAPAKPARYILQDTTTEKLAEILGRASRGALVHRDELSGWIGSLEKYGKGGAADRAAWLKAYDGGRWTVDRVGRGETVVENYCVSFLGGIQPDRLAELGDLASDGLLQRFVPVMLGKSSLPEEVDDCRPVEAFTTLINRLAETLPCRLLCESGAHDITRAIQVELHGMEQSGAFSKPLTGFLGKLMGVYGSLMLVLHLAADPHGAPCERVATRTAEAARRIVLEFILPHALAFYATTDDKTEGELTRSIASYVLTSPLTRFRAADLTANVSSLRGLGVWDLGRKLSPLIAGGWLRPEDDNPSCRAWIVEPGVREAFKARAEGERERRADIRARLQKIRGQAA